jgi:hypothetical protein
MKTTNKRIEKVIHGEVVEHPKKLKRLPKPRSKHKIEPLSEQQQYENFLVHNIEVE